MDKNTIWSLRLGFSAKQAKAIEKSGLKTFLTQSYESPYNSAIPELLASSPKSIEELKETRKALLASNPDGKKELLKKDQQTSAEMKAWWIDEMMNSEFPLREKMTCFWHNHYVATFQKVKVNYWVFQHNQILRENAFGNFKTLTKKIIQTNAMVRYLDNVDNRKDKLNENLSRELLELFTLGIGNYTEEDIKNGAKGLAGLGIGADNAIYRRKLEDNEPFSYLGKNGSLKVDEMVDAIFDQPNIPYLIIRKILKWFIYDAPDEKLVRYYGDYFKKNNFEIKPLLTKIFTEEFAKNNAGSKIKSPIEYLLQLQDELQIETANGRAIVYFIKQQGMDLFNQPNVKGWDGGNSWLTSQVYLQRNTIADLLCNGKNYGQNKAIQQTDSMMNTMNMKENRQLNVKLNWNDEGTNTEIIADLSNRLLFQVDANTQLDFEKILKYDFDSKTAGSAYAVMRLFNFMIKTPEYQLI
jgi:uncharacterized protein (DUF1800 family)